MTNSVWGQDTPCPNDGCPKPGPWRGLMHYRTRQWVCPLCCHGWVCQTTGDPSWVRWVRTARPVPYYRPGRKKPLL